MGPARIKRKYDQFIGDWIKFRVNFIHFMFMYRHCFICSHDHAILKISVIIYVWAMTFHPIFGNHRKK